MLKKLYEKFCGQDSHTTTLEEMWLLHYLSGDLHGTRTNKNSYQKALDKVLSICRARISGHFAHVNKKRLYEEWMAQSSWILFLKNDLAGIMQEITLPLPRETLLHKNCFLAEEELAVHRLFPILPDCEYKLSVLIVLILQPGWVLTEFSLYHHKEFFFMTENWVDGIMEKKPILGWDEQLKIAISVNWNAVLILSLYRCLARIKNETIITRLIP